MDGALGVSANSYHRSAAATSAVLGVVLLVFAGSPAAAAPPEIGAGTPACVPSGGNAVASTLIKPETGWASIRAYFRAGGQTDWYFMEMRATGAGSYFAVLPKPVSATKSVDLQVQVRDADGVVTRGPLANVKVGSCSVTLTEEQKRYAENLVAGETVESQKNKVLAGFECEGVVSRIDVQGAIRPDDACRRAIIAAANKTAIIIPAIIVGVGGAAVIIINNQEHKETSPSR
jgi:hypothetical protein